MCMGVGAVGRLKHIGRERPEQGGGKITSRCKRAAC